MDTRFFRVRSSVDFRTPKAFGQLDDYISSETRTEEKETGNGMSTHCWICHKSINECSERSLQACELEELIEAQKNLAKATSALHAYGKCTPYWDYDNAQLEAARDENKSNIVGAICEARLLAREALAEIGKGSGDTNA